MNLYDIECINTEGITTIEYYLWLDGFGVDELKNAAINRTVYHVYPNNDVYPNNSLTEIFINFALWPIVRISRVEKDE